MKTTAIQTGENSFNVLMEDLTEGKLMAILKAFSDYSQKSIVCNDVLISFQRAIEKAEKDKKIKIVEMAEIVSKALDN